VPFLFIQIWEAKHEDSNINKFGRSVLGYAKEAGNTEIIKILKEAGARE
jgi:hypothetical protein